MRFGIPAALLAVIALAFPTFASADPLGSMTLFSSGLRGAGLINELTSGPDGNVWFVEAAAEPPAIGRITPSGEIKDFEAGTELPKVNVEGSLVGIAVGPEGKLWFTDKNEITPAIGVIDPANPESAEEFSIAEKGGNTGAKPQGIVTGPDGNLWFADASETTPAIGMINPTTHEVKEFPIKEEGGFEGSRPHGIVVGSDGNLWFTDTGATRAIGKINPSTHKVEEFTTGENSQPGGSGGEAGPWGIATGADGNVWFTESGTNITEGRSATGRGIGRITPSGTITYFSTGLAAGTFPWALTGGAPDGKLWFTDKSGVNEKQELVIEATASLGGTFKLAFEGKETGVVGIGDLTSGSKEVKNVSASSGAFIKGEEISGTGIPAGTFIEKCSNGNTCGAGVTKVFLTQAATETKAGVSLTANLSVKVNTSNTNTTIKQALENLSTIGAGNAGASGTGTTSPIKRTITFEGKLSSTDMAQLTCNGAGLTGTSPTCTVTTVKAGVPNAIGSISTSGEITEEPRSELNRGNTLGITNGPGGNVWFSTGFASLQKLGKYGIEPKLNLEVVCTGAGSGTVSPVACGSAAEFESGKKVTLEAVPAKGSELGGWTGCESNPTPSECVVTISGFTAKKVTVNFEEEGPTNKRTLTLTKSPAGNAGSGIGSVSSKPKGVKCATTCNEAIGHFYKEQAVLLTAAPSGETSAFKEWKGTVCNGSTSLTCTVPAGTADQSVEAVFKGSSKAFSPAEALTLSKGESEVNRGYGTVKASGLTCEAECDETAVLYQGPITLPKPKAGKMVELKEAPAFGSKFVGWSGACSGTEPVCKVTMEGAEPVTAEYAALPNKVLTVEKAYAGGLGSVSSKPKGISCGTTCTATSANMPEGSSILLTAKVATTEPATTFVKWEGGDCAGKTELTCTVGMDKAETVKAVFSGPVKTINEPKTLTLTKEGKGFGTVKASGLACEALCASATSLYTGPVTLPKPKAGAKVILKATPAPGSTAVTWSGCTPLNATECEVVMNTNASVTAKFDELE